MKLHKRNVTWKGNYLFKFNDNILLVGAENGILVIDLNKYEIIQDLNIIPLTETEFIGIKDSDFGSSHSGFIYRHGIFYMNSSNFIIREFFGPFCKIGKNKILVGDSIGNIYLLEYNNNNGSFCFKNKKDIFKNQKSRLKRENPLNMFILNITLILYSF